MISTYLRAHYWRLLRISFPIVLWISVESNWLHISNSLSQAGHRALLLLITMAWWWLSETWPLHWVALLPILALPLFPIVKLDAPWIERTSANIALVASHYVNPLILFFFGAMLIGLAMEHQQLHKRIALHIIKYIGCVPHRLVLGVLISTAFISMWMSNTATALMMTPIALALIHTLEKREKRKLLLLGQSMLLAVAYGANIGGISTLIGTSTNIVFAGFIHEQYQINIGFLDYMKIGFPYVIILLSASFALLTFMSRKEKIKRLDPDVLQTILSHLGPLRKGERLVFIVFLITCILWMSNISIRSGAGIIHAIKGDQFDMLVSLLAGGVLLLSGTLPLKVLKRFPYAILLLLGGSYALAAIAHESGLSLWFADEVKEFRSLSPFPMLLLISSVTVFLSAFTANAATAGIMLALIADTIDPTRTLFMGTFPYLTAAAIASSCDFMMPCGAPPNAIVFTTKYVRIRDMAIAGFLIDCLSAICLSFWLYFFFTLN